MLRPQISRIRNQRKLPNAGDVDECAVASDEAAAHACAPWEELPGTTAYRRAAGNPDDPNAPDGLTLQQSVLAIRSTWPRLAARLRVYVKGETSWPGITVVLEQIRGGAIASLSVLSGALPAKHRYGFDGRHRIALAWWAGQLWIANPLAPPESKWLPISEQAIRDAVKAYPGDGHGGAILFPSPDQALADHPGLQNIIDQAQADALARLGAVKAKVARMASDVADD